MSLSVREIVVPTMIHGLGVMDDYVDHAERLAAAKTIPISEILDTRLAPDMLSFAEQIAVLCNKVEVNVSKLARRDVPALVKLLQTSAALKARIADAVRYLNGLAPEDLAGAESRTYDLSPLS